jgi:adenine-specific DNA-methyltransferase
MQFPYMGTKRALAPIVSEIASSRPHGVFLDAFSGMCSVAQQLVGSRTVWTNDLQSFARNAAEAYLDPMDPKISDFTNPINDAASQKYQELVECHRSAVNTERRSLVAKGFTDFYDRAERASQNIPRLPRRNYDLFTCIYGGTYFSIEQAIEIDALCYAIHTTLHGAESKSARARVLLALGKAMLATSSSTGHFAQFQTPSAKNWRRIQKTRRKSVIESFNENLILCAKLGTTRNRHENRYFSTDSITLLRHLPKCHIKPTVIYADPPYKQDQYSRYYHLLETLVLYDFPKVTSKARYREKRENSTFSWKAHARKSIERLCSFSARTGADLILSYPEDGLAAVSSSDILALMRRSYPTAEIAYSSELRHSTMGASKGAAKKVAQEFIYHGRFQ